MAMSGILKNIEPMDVSIVPASNPAEGKNPEAVVVWKLRIKKSTTPYTSFE